MSAYSCNVCGQGFEGKGCNCDCLPDKRQVSYALLFVRAGVTAQSEYVQATSENVLEFIRDFLGRGYALMGIETAR